MSADWGWLAVMLLATAAGQMMFKSASDQRSRSLTLAAVAVFCLAPPASYLALRSLSLSTVYVSTALAQLAVVLASMWLFGDRYSRTQWIGLALIIVGVVIFNFPGTP